MQKKMMTNLIQKKKHIVWSCSNCSKFNKLDSKEETERQLFKRFVDDKNFTVSGEPDNLLRKVNIFKTNLEITMARTEETYNLVF